MQGGKLQALVSSVTISLIDITICKTRLEKSATEVAPITQQWQLLIYTTLFKFEQTFFHVARSGFSSLTLSLLVEKEAFCFHL